jgi:hypothetical protein
VQTGQNPVTAGPPVDRDADDTKLLSQVIDFYHETLKQSPEALAYLKKRGLESQELQPCPGSVIPFPNAQRFDKHAAVAFVPLFPLITEKSSHRDGFPVSNWV